MGKYSVRSYAAATLLVAAVGMQFPHALHAKPYHRLFPLRSLPRVAIRIGSHRITAWVMSTDAEREEGLMGVPQRDLPANKGMLFVFPYPQPLLFWMKNTEIPLDIAFIGADHRVENTRRMKAEDLTPIPSAGSAEYALEMRAGDIQRYHIRAGMMVEMPSSLRAR